MKISSEHINNLLAYARERHGAPCLLFLEEATVCWEDEDEACIDVSIYYRDQLPGFKWLKPVERILI